MRKWEAAFMAGLAALALGLAGCDLLGGGGGGGGGAAPAVPTGLAIDDSAPFWFLLSWNASSGAATYQVYCDISASGSFATKVYDGSATSFLDMPVTPGGTYYYKVAATNSSGSSSLSGPVVGTAIGTVAWMAGGDGLWFMTNETSYLNTLQRFAITTSTLSLGQTLTTSVNQVCGSSNSGLGVTFLRQDASNYWMLGIFPPNDPAVAGYCEIDQVVAGTPTAIAGGDLTMNEIGGTTANTLSVTYDFSSPNYRLRFYLNGGLVWTETSASPYAGAGGYTGFFTYISDKETFPALPVWHIFAQSSPVVFIGSMLNMVPGGASLKRLEKALPKLPAPPKGPAHRPVPLHTF